MSDLDDMLDEFEEPTYQETEKKGAPKIDAADLAGLLDDEPAVWTGSEQKKGAPVLDTQNLLDEQDQTWQEQKPAHPDAALLSAADDLLGEEPAAYNPVEEFCQKLQFDENLKSAFVNLDAEKQMQVVNMRAQQLGIPAPMIPNELRPKAPAPEEVSAEESMLEEAPETEEYVPQFKDEDLERAKREAAQPRKEEPQIELSEEEKQENRRRMAQERERMEREQARKGFKTLIMLTVIGVIGAVAFCLFFSNLFNLGSKLIEAGEGGIALKLKGIAGYVGAAFGICSLLLAAPLPSLRSFCKLVDIISFLMLLISGIPLLMQTEGNVAVLGVLFAAALFSCGFSAVTLITNDNIEKYNKYGNS